MPAESAVVADHHQVVDLRPLADPRRPEGASVDRRAGADLDVVGDLDVTELRNLDVPTVLEPVAEPVGPDHRLSVDDDAVAEDRTVVKDGVRKEGHVVAEPAIPAEDDAAMDTAAGPDHAAGADDRERVDARVRADPGRGIDVGFRVDPVRRRFTSAVQVSGDGDERSAGIGDPDQGLAVGRGGNRHDRRAGPRLVQIRKMSFVFGKRHMAVVGLVQAAGSMDGHVAVPVDFPSHQGRQFADGARHRGSFHAGGLAILPIADGIQPRTIAGMRSGGNPKSRRAQRLS